MPGETSFAKIKYAVSTDEPKAFPAEVSEPGAKTTDKFLEEKTLHIKKYAGGGTLASGELAYQEKTAETFTLPLAATENQLIGVFSTVAETKITTSGGTTISGDFVEAVATIVLSTNQHVILQSVNGKWIIIAGEPKREQKYVATEPTVVEAEAGITPSTTRKASVTVTVRGELEKLTDATFTVEGVTVGRITVGPTTGANNRVPITFPMVPGKAWKISAPLHVEKLTVATLLE